MSKSAEEKFKDIIESAKTEARIYEKLKKLLNKVEATNSTLDTVLEDLDKKK